MQLRTLFTRHIIQLKPNEKTTMNYYAFIIRTRTPLFLDSNQSKA